MREHFVLIGAGSAMFTRGLVSDLISTGAECDLSLVDIDPIALEAANPAYETRIFGPDRVQIQGKLVGLFRRY